MTVSEAEPQDPHLERARALDAADPLADVAKRFELGTRDASSPARSETPGRVYLAGNSLGPLASGVTERVRRTLEEWGHQLAAGWSGSGWMEAPYVLGDRIAPLIGAGPGEVLVADTTSVALAKLAGAALDARPGKRIVVSTTDNFPSDLFAARGAARLQGSELRIVGPDDLESTLAELHGSVALCCVTQVDFRTGALHDVGRITERAHAAGALMLWDLCHSAGAVPVGCNEHGVDLAVGCTYKYLNGGPGSPSFLYARRDLIDELANPIPGWLGHEAPFDFELEWRPAHGIARFLTSSPPVLALAALDAALDAFDGVSIQALRDKSKRLGELFVDVVEAAQVPELQLASPRDPERRGSQVSLAHPRASELVAIAAQRGVTGDMRPPDICRFGLGPLYLSYEDVYRGARTVVEVASYLSGDRDR